MAKNEVKKEEVLTLEERFATIEELVAKINEAFKADKGQAAVKYLKMLDENIKAYNEVLRFQEYDKFLSTDDPVLSALEQGDITQIVAKRGVIKDTDIQQVSIDNRQVLVDLPELCQYAKRLIVVSGQWIYRIEAFAKTLSERIAKDVENKVAKADIAKNYKISDAAAALEGVKDPLSNKSLKVAGQEICDMIHEGYVFKGKDLNYLLLTMTRQSAKSRATLVAPRTKTVVKLFTEMMHRMVCEKQYGVEFNKKSDAK